MDEKTLKKYRDKGIVILDPRNTYIGPEVQLSRGNVINPNTYMNGRIKIDAHNVLGPNLHLEGKVTIGRKNHISYSHIVDTKIGNDNVVGPYARLRDKTVIGNKTKIGNYVEIKNSNIGDKTQIAHLSYIGDAKVGKDANIGAGTITANYNSITGKKSKTTIKDKAATGANSVLVAPITVGEGAMVGAGSVVTQSVPDHSLAVARTVQETKQNWVKKAKRTTNKRKRTVSKRTKTK